MIAEVAQKWSCRGGVLGAALLFFGTTTTSSSSSSIVGSPVSHGNLDGKLVHFHGMAQVQCPYVQILAQTTIGGREEVKGVCVVAVILLTFSLSWSEPRETVAVGDSS